MKKNSLLIDITARVEPPLIPLINSESAVTKKESNNIKVTIWRNPALATLETYKTKFALF